MHRIQWMQWMQEEGGWQHRGGTKLQDQADPLIMKETLETQAMRWRHDMKIVQRKINKKRRSYMCWSGNSRKNRSCTDERMSCSRNRYSRGCKMHRWMKLHPHKLWIHPNSWHGVDKVSKGIQQYACHCVHACDPTHLAHLLRRRQEASPTGACYHPKKLT